MQSPFGSRISAFFRPSDLGFRISRPRRSGPAAGFTLVEMMVVVVLIGIVSAVIIPEMKGTYEEALLRSTSRTLVNAFSLAYSRAVALNQAHRVRLDRAGGRYVLEQRSSSAPREDAFLPVRDVPGSAGELDKRITVSLRQSGEAIPEETQEPASPELHEPSESPDEQEAIAFYPDGTAQRAEILLTDREGFRLLLRINPVTARVHVTDLGRR